MSWDARNIDDYVYHRRRFVFALVVIVLSVMTIGARASDIAERGWRYFDVLAAVWVILSVYATWQAVAEYKLMKQAKHRQELR